MLLFPWQANEIFQWILLRLRLALLLAQSAMPTFDPQKFDSGSAHRSGWHVELSWCSYLLFFAVNDRWSPIPIKKPHKSTFHGSTHAILQIRLLCPPRIWKRGNAWFRTKLNWFALQIFMSHTSKFKCRIVNIAFCIFIISYFCKNCNSFFKNVRIFCWSLQDFFRQPQINTPMRFATHRGWFYMRSLWHTK